MSQAIAWTCTAQTCLFTNQNLHITEALQDQFQAKTRDITCHRDHHTILWGLIIGRVNLWHQRQRIRSSIMQEQSTQSMAPPLTDLPWMRLYVTPLELPTFPLQSTVNLSVMVITQLHITVQLMIILKIMHCPQLGTTELENKVVKQRMYKVVKQRLYKVVKQRM